MNNLNQRLSFIYRLSQYKSFVAACLYCLLLIACKAEQYDNDCEVIETPCASNTLPGFWPISSQPYIDEDGILFLANRTENIIERWSAPLAKSIGPLKVTLPRGNPQISALLYAPEEQRIYLGDIGGGVSYVEQPTERSSEVEALPLFDSDFGPIERLHFTNSGLLIRTGTDVVSISKNGDYIDHFTIEPNTIHARLQWDESYQRLVLRFRSDDDQSDFFSYHTRPLDFQGYFQDAIDLSLSPDMDASLLWPNYYDLLSNPPSLGLSASELAYLAERGRVEHTLFIPDTNYIFSVTIFLPESKRNSEIEIYDRETETVLYQGYFEHTYRSIAIYQQTLVLIRYQNFGLVVDQLDIEQDLIEGQIPTF